MLYKDYASNPIPTFVLLQTSILNNLMACIACKIISGIRESVDSLCRDGADTPIVRVHRKAFLTLER